METDRSRDAEPKADPWAALDLKHLVELEPDQARAQAENISTQAQTNALLGAILGVSLGDEGDKSTWIIRFDPSATKDQQSAAQAVVAAFDPEAPEHQPGATRDLAADIDALKAALIKKAVVSNAEIEAEKGAEVAAETKR